MAIHTVTNRQGEHTTFESPYSDKDAVSRLRGLEMQGATPAGFGKFAEDLLLQRKLSPRQMEWVHFMCHLADNDTTPNLLREVTGLRIVTMFDLAKSKGIEKPRCTVGLKDGVELKFWSRQGLNTIRVYDPATSKLRATIGRDGRIHTREEPLSNQHLAILVVFAENPESMAKAYGRRVGACCFCGRRLDLRYWSVRLHGRPRVRAWPGGGRRRQGGRCGRE